MTSAPGGLSIGDMKRWTVLVVASVVACGGSSKEPEHAASTSGSTSATPSANPSTSSSVTTLAALGGAATPVESGSGKHHHKIGSGWFLTGTAKDAYAAELDDAVRDGAGLSVAVRPVGETHNSFVSLIKNVDATPYIGKKVRVTLRVKTEGLTARAEAWARAQAPDSPTDGPGLGEGKAKLDATADMKTYTVDLEVKSGARFIQYGVGIAGPGKFWVGHDTIEALP